MDPRWVVFANVHHSDFLLLQSGFDTRDAITLGMGPGGVGMGSKVVGHMPWGALSGSPWVQGHGMVFWGCCGGFCTPVVQCMQDMQILIAYLRIHANTCKYLQIPI
jgi:hypothetical protein